MTVRLTQNQGQMNFTYHKTTQTYYKFFLKTTTTTKTGLQVERHIVSGVSTAQCIQDETVRMFNVLEEKYPEFKDFPWDTKAKVFGALFSVDCIMLDHIIQYGSEELRKEDRLFILEKIGG